MCGSISRVSRVQSAELLDPSKCPEAQYGSVWVQYWSGPSMDASPIQESVLTPELWFLISTLSVPSAGLTVGLSCVASLLQSQK